MASKYQNNYFLLLHLSYVNQFYPWYDCLFYYKQLRKDWWIFCDARKLGKYRKQSACSNREERHMFNNTTSTVVGKCWYKSRLYVHGVWRSFVCVHLQQINVATFYYICIQHNLHVLNNTSREKDSNRSGLISNTFRY